MLPHEGSSFFWGIDFLANEVRSRKMDLTVVMKGKKCRIAESFPAKRHSVVLQFVQRFPIGFIFSWKVLSS
jgi:hypothetical protein